VGFCQFGTQNTVRYCKKYYDYYPAFSAILPTGRLSPYRKKVSKQTKNYVRRNFCPRKLVSSGCFTGQKWRKFCPTLFCPIRYFFLNIFSLLFNNYYYYHYYVFARREVQTTMHKSTWYRISTAQKKNWWQVAASWRTNLSMNSNGTAVHLLSVRCAYKWSVMIFLPAKCCVMHGNERRKEDTHADHIYKSHINLYM